MCVVRLQRTDIYIYRERKNVCVWLQITDIIYIYIYIERERVVTDNGYI